MTIRTMAVSILLILLTGCASVMEGLQDVLTTPTARVAGVDFVGFDLEGVELGFQVEIANPYGVELPLVELGYGLASAGQQFLSGTAPFGGTVPARSRRTITLPLRVEFLPTLRTLTSVRPGQVVDYEAALSLRVDPPMTEALSIPLSHRGQLPIPAPPSLTVPKISWSEVSLTKVRGDLHLGVGNPNEFAVDLSRVAWGLKLAGRDIARGTADQPTSLAAGAAAELVIPLELSPLDLGSATLQLLQGGGAGYELFGDMNLGTPFGALDVPFDKSGQTLFER